MKPNGSTRDRVVMLVKNSFVFDARVRKEAVSLRTAGWDVAVIALHVPGATPRFEETQEGIPVWRVPQLFPNRQKWLGAATATPVMRGKDSVGEVRYASGLATLRRRLVDVIRRMSPVVIPTARRLNSIIVDRRMIRLAAALGPRVVHSHDLNTLSAGRRLADKTHARLVYDAHEFHRARNGMGARAALSAARLEDRLAPQADLVITATDTWADRLHGLWGSAQRPLVLRNSPPSSRVDAPVDLRGRLSIPVRSPVLVYIGSVQLGRGIEQAMEALLLLPSAHLVVLGYGAYLPQLCELRNSLGLTERVHFPGPVDNREVVQCVAGADVGLCLIGNTSYSYFTSLPNKLLDYVQARIPVVTSDFPEMGRFVRQHGVGEVCDPANPRSVAKAVNRVLSHRGQYAEALEAAAQATTWETEEEGLLSAYEALAAAGTQCGGDLQ